jgi:hypothetical protein
MPYKSPFPTKNDSYGTFTHAVVLGSEIVENNM